MRADRPNFGPESSASHAIHIRLHGLALRLRLRGPHVFKEWRSRQVSKRAEAQAEASRAHSGVHQGRRAAAAEVMSHNCNTTERGQSMLKDISRMKVAGMWCAAVTALATISMVWGIALTPNSSVLWLVACLVPPAVMLLVWRGPPPLTVAELLYAVDQPSKNVKP
jgi:hypothetical protein